MRQHKRYRAMTGANPIHTCGIERCAAGGLGGGKLHCTCGAAIVSPANERIRNVGLGVSPLIVPPKGGSTGGSPPMTLHGFGDPGVGFAPVGGQSSSVGFGSGFPGGFSTTASDGPKVQPKFTTTTQVQKPICGPDVTQDFVDKLWDFVNEIDKAWANNPPKVKSVRFAMDSVEVDVGSGAASHQSLMAFLKLILPDLGSVDYKPKDFAACASGACKDTVRLCGYCINDDVPGNIAFGFGWEYAGIGSDEDMSRISDDQNRFSTLFQKLGGKPDSPEDKATTKGGLKASKKFKEKGKGKKKDPKAKNDPRHQDKEGATKDDLKDVICGMLKELIDGGTTEQKPDCEECPNPL